MLTDSTLYYPNPQEKRYLKIIGQTQLSERIALSSRLTNAYCTFKKKGSPIIFIEFHHIFRNDVLMHQKKNSWRCKICSIFVPILKNNYTNYAEKFFIIRRSSIHSCYSNGALFQNLTISNSKNFNLAKKVNLKFQLR